MNEIYQCLFDIIATPDAPKPYRDIAVWLKKSHRDTEVAGVSHLLQQVFKENEEHQPALSESEQSNSDNQNSDVA